MTLRLRIALISGAGVLLAVLVTAFVVYASVRSDLRGEVDRGLSARSELYTTGGPSRLALEHPRTLTPDNGPEGPFGDAAGRVEFVATTGRTSAAPGEPAAPLIPVSAAQRKVARTGSGQILADETVDGTHIRVLTVGRGAGHGAVQVVRPLAEVDAALHRLAVRLALVGLAGALAAAILGALLARSALAPVTRFTRRTERIADGANLSERLEVKGHDEISRLARTFNATLDELERSVQSQRQLVADAGHELRTPITSLRANIQLLDRADQLSPADLTAVRADIVSELDELTALVGDLVELARGAEPVPQDDPVRLDLITHSSVERAQRRSPSLRFRLDAEPVVVQGDGERIERAVRNLLDNAATWSPADSTVYVTVAGDTVTVTDEGPGFPPDELDQVFARFHRSEAARGMPGSGLGLALVRATAEAHGGTATASNGPMGGARVTASFGPAERPAES